MRFRATCNPNCKRYSYDLVSPCLWGSGPSDAKLMLVGRDPGQQEDLNGKVFVGESGQLLDEILRTHGVGRDEVYVTNVVKCGTPGFNVDPGAKEVSACRHNLIEELAEVKPNVVVVFGNTAMMALLGIDGITKYCNQVLYSGEFDLKVIPTYHPAFVLRDSTQRKYLEQGIELAVREMSSKAKVSGGFEKTRFTVAETVEDVQAIFDEIETVETFAFDTETSQLSFLGTTILCIQFSWKKGSAVVIPWCLIEKYSNLFDGLKRIMGSRKLKVAHNIKFDIEQLLAKGIHTAIPYFDVCVAHGLVDDNSKHSLDVMVLRYTNLGNYWQPLEAFKKEYCKEHKIKLEAFSYAYLPKEILYPYGASDADATYQLYAIMHDALISENVIDFYKNDSLLFLPMIVEMEYRGISVDRGKLFKLLGQCRTKLAEYGNEIVQYEEVKKYEKWKTKRESIDQIHMLRARRDESDTLKKRFPEWEAYVKKYLKVKSFEFNMDSPQQLRELFCDVMGYTSPKKTKKNQSSVDKEVLLYFSEEKGIPLAAVMNNRRKLAHFINNFALSVYEKSAKDGRVHTSYIQTDAVTGRLSSRGPNLQNLSRDENLPVLFTQAELEEYKVTFGEYPVTPYEFKSCLLADLGYILIKGDLAQVEFRVWAHCSGDEDMIADIEAGLDIHRRTASELFGIPPEEVVTWQRNAAKGGTFGMMYGIGDRTLAKNFKITLEQAHSIRGIFSARYPIAAQWLQKQVDFAVANGYVVNFLGRKRRLPKINERDQDVAAYAERQARNSPIQGAASDMNNRFMQVMVNAVRDKGEDIYPVCTTHDENVFAVPDDPDIVRARVEDYKLVVATTFPNLRCKMNVEFKVGYSIGGAKEYKI